MVYIDSALRRAHFEKYHYKKSATTVVVADLTKTCGMGLNAIGFTPSVLRLLKLFYFARRLTHLHFYAATLHVFLCCYLSANVVSSLLVFSKAATSLQLF